MRNRRRLTTPPDEDQVTAALALAVIIALSSGAVWLVLDAIIRTGGTAP